jgi:hypothetical protein
MEGTMHKRPWFRIAEFAAGLLLCFSFLDRFQILQMKATKEQQAADGKHAKDASKRSAKDARRERRDEESGPFVDRARAARDGRAPAKPLPPAPRVAALASVYGSAAKGQELHAGRDAAGSPLGRDEVGARSLRRVRHCRHRFKIN